MSISSLVRNSLPNSKDTWLVAYALGSKGGPLDNRKGWQSMDRVCLQRFINHLL